MTPTNQLLDRLKDLHIQATTERSHYYVASVVKECIAHLEERDREIERLKETISYLPKVPTQPYEKELAQEVMKLRDLLAKAKDLAEFYGQSRYYIEECSLGVSVYEEAETDHVEFGTKARAFLKELEGV